MKYYIYKDELIAEPMDKAKAVELGLLKSINDYPHLCEGYHIICPDGHEYWCPGDSFEKVCNPSHTHLDRLYRETGATENKYNKAKHYIESEQSKFWLKEARQLLEEQIKPMLSYLTNLKKRIEHFERKESDNDVALDSEVFYFVREPDKMIECSDMQSFGNRWDIFKKKHRIFKTKEEAIAYQRNFWIPTEKEGRELNRMFTEAGLAELYGYK